MAKKIQITEALIKKVEQVFNEGKGSLSRPELRALYRKGYLDRKSIRINTGSLRYEYGLKRSF